jgi:hypothetical protein
MEPLVLIFAAAAAWTGDDWCPTPPRPPWPWPWFLRKIIAALGGIGGVILFNDMMGEGVNILSIAVVAIVSGVSLASLAGGIGAMTSKPVNRVDG